MRAIKLSEVHINQEFKHMGKKMIKTRENSASAPSLSTAITLIGNIEHLISPNTEVLVK